MKAKDTEPDKPRQRIYVTLNPDAIAIARKLGNGVVSRGIDRALFEFQPKRRREHARTTNPTD